MTGLSHNTYYTFSAWVYNVGPQLPLKPNLTFLVDGVGEYTTGPITSSGWQEIGFPFYSGNNTSLSLAIRNNQTGGNGNDWIIDDISVTICNPVIIITSEDEVCVNDTITITAEVMDPAEQFDDYIWQKFNPISNQWEDITAVTSGTYVDNVMTVTYEVTTAATLDMDGDLYRIIVSNSPSNFNNPELVTASDEVMITVNPSPDVVATSSDTLTCAVTEVNLIAEPSGLSYEWSGPDGFMSTAESPEVSEPGSYSVTVTDTNGCTNEAIVEVEQDIEANIEVLDQEMCLGDSVALLAIVDETSIVSITWDNGAGTGDSVIVSPAVTTTYTATALFSNGCEATADATVTVLSAVLVDAGPNVSFCDDETDPQVLVPLVSGGTPPYTLSWTGPGGFTFDGFNPIVSEAGIYTLSLIHI